MSDTQTSNGEVLTEAYVRDRYDSGLRDMEDNYTTRRWFSSPEAAFDYKETRRAFLHAFGDARFKKGLELGPGDGVWTKYVADRFAKLELLDQSVEMLKRAETALKQYDHITYTKANIAEHDFGHAQYDCIMTVRCFEYIIDKPAALKKFYDALLPGGKFILITKSPNYRSLKNWKRPLMHTEQVGKRELTDMLRDQGFVVEAVYPAVLRWKSNYAIMRALFGLLHWIAVRTNGRLYIPWLTDMATESYTYVARKDKVLVELYGLSGSGKTTLASELAKDPLVKRLRPQGKRAGLLYFIRHNPRLFFSWTLRMLVHSTIRGKWKLLRHRLAILMSTFGAVGSAQRVSGGIVVIEEGLYMRVNSIYEEHMDADAFLSLMRHMPHMNGLVIIEPRGEIFARYDATGRNPRSGRGEAYMRAWKEMILHNNTTLLEAIGRMRLPVFMYRKNAAPADVLAYVKSL